MAWLIAWSCGLSFFCSVSWSLLPSSRSFIRKGGSDRTDEPSGSVYVDFDLSK